jgi:hypothetical protein
MLLKVYSESQYDEIRVSPFRRTFDRKIKLNCLLFIGHLFNQNVVRILQKVKGVVLWLLFSFSQRRV